MGIQCGRTSASSKDIFSRCLAGGGRTAQTGSRDACAPYQLGLFTGVVGGCRSLSTESPCKLIKEGKTIMGLSLGVKVGDDVLIGDYVIVVREVTAGDIKVTCGENKYAISKNDYVEVAPDVRIRRGEAPRASQTYPRLDIAAPRKMAISFYRRDRSVNLQKRLVHLCEVVARGHKWPWVTLQRLCAKSHRARRAMEAILADPQSPRFGEDWESRFKYLVSSPHPVQGGLPGLGRRS